MNIQEETTLKQSLLNKEITAIEFYNVNKKYMVFDEEHIWVIDGGIEFTFGTETFSFGWNYEKGFYENSTGKIETLTEGMHVKALEAQNIEGIKALIGTQVTAAEIAWNWYSDLDENYEPTEVKHYMPMGIQLQFANGSAMQLAAVRYEIDVDNKSMTDITYDSEGELLIALNQPQEIKAEVTVEE